MLSRELILTAFMTLGSFDLCAAIEAPRALDISDEKVNVFEMKRKIQNQNKEIQSLSREITDVEFSLGMNNKKYLLLAESRLRIEESLASARRNADFDSENLKKNYSQTKNLLMGVLLNKLENTEKSSDILARKIMVEKLQRRLADLDGMMKANKNLKDYVEETFAKLQQSMETEKELLAVMNDLEEKKRELKNSLLAQTKDSEEARARFDEVKNKLAMSQKSAQLLKERARLAPLQITEEIKIPSQPGLSGEYYPPIYSYQAMEHQKKGVTFNFQGKNEVRATKAGKIVYTGSLANYGNVLMIDHGNDTRTVLLGQFDYAVKNGDTVRDAQVVGHTNPRESGLGEGKIYFEVRKNNLAQNTYLLLDKKSLVKTSSN